MYQNLIWGSEVWKLEHCYLSVMNALEMGDKETTFFYALWPKNPEQNPEQVV